MQIPTYQKFITPLLNFLASDEAPHKPSEVYAGLADLVGLTAEDKSLMLPSGTQSLYKNRIGWAQDAIKRSELTYCPSRGLWQITQKGIDLVKQYNGDLPKDLEKGLCSS